MLGCLLLLNGSKGAATKGPRGTPKVSKTATKGSKRRGHDAKTTKQGGDGKTTKQGGDGKTTKVGSVSRVQQHPNITVCEHHLDVNNRCLRQFQNMTGYIQCLIKCGFYGLVPDYIMITYLIALSVTWLLRFDY